MGLKTDFAQRVHARWLLTLLSHNSIQPGKLWAAVVGYTQQGIGGHWPGLLELTAPHHMPQMLDTELQDAMFALLEQMAFSLVWNPFLLSEYRSTCGVRILPCAVGCGIYVTFFILGLGGSQFKSMLLIKRYSKLGLLNGVGLVETWGLVEEGQRRFALWSGPEPLGSGNWMFLFECAVSPQAHLLCTGSLAAVALLETWGSGTSPEEEDMGMHSLAYLVLWCVCLTFCTSVCWGNHTGKVLCSPLCDGLGLWAQSTAPPSGSHQVFWTVVQNNNVSKAEIPCSSSY